MTNYCMADTFQLEIVTPEKMVVRDVAEEMQIPGKDGYLGILPGHAPLITELAVGEIAYRKDDPGGDRGACRRD
jgi:F-type H+-transporting ATPase subunit epsilon